MNKTEKLLPCPLCGSESKHVKADVGGHRILCWNDDCECSSGYFCSKEEAITSWNTRAALAATPAAEGSVSNATFAAAPVVLPEPDFYVRPSIAAYELPWQVCNGSASAEPVYLAATVRALLATGGQAQAVAEDERSAWFALAMNSAAYIEDAAACLRDGDAKRSAAGAAKHVREKCNALWDSAPQAQADARDAEQERWVEIGKAIERACIDQPDSTEIVISLERDAGTVTMFDPDGNEHDQFSHEDGFAGVVNAAIEAAIAAAKGE